MPLFPPQFFRKTRGTHRIGTFTDLPAAADVLIGTLYFATDTYNFYRSNGTTWDTYAPIQGEFTTTSTGNIDDLDFSNANIIRVNNATLATIRGLKAGYSGQRVTLVAIGAARFELAHQNNNSVAANRLINGATSANSPVVDGYATYQYDGTTQRWRMIAHDQGSPITPTFAAGNYTASGAMTWTVAAGDITFQRYNLKFKQLFVDWVIVTTSIGGTPDNQLFIGNGAWGGFTTFNNSIGNAAAYINDGVIQTNGYINPNGTTIGIVKVPITVYPASVDNTFTYGACFFPVT